MECRSWRIVVPPWTHPLTFHGTSQTALCLHVSPSTEQRSRILTCRVTNGSTDLLGAQEPYKGDLAGRMFWVSKPGRITQARSGSRRGAEPAEPAPWSPRRRPVPAGAAGAADAVKSGEGGGKNREQ